ncbi:MAG TPA: DUF368 domain-containing protein [Flavobacteriaceae bacterium]|nr:DUF368 domain-containing protein [Flavobacteriaceae bacterium]
MPKRSLLQYLIITLKGLAMGAADIVPGVSGGTIALIAGFYEELLETIDGLDFKIFKKWRENGFLLTWREYNLSFLLALGIGIATSILLLAKVIGSLIDSHPILVWSFFFGLVLASILYLIKQLEKWNAAAIASIVIASIFAFGISSLSPLTEIDSVWFLFVAGFIAIIAMILPGISGAFILILLGAYQPVIHLINQLNQGISQGDSTLLLQSIGKISIFLLGAAIGLKAFSRALTWMFNHHKNTTLAMLTGFMIGALNKIWPWKEVLQTRLNSKGEEVAFIEQSVSPTNFAEPKLTSALICLVAGFLIIFILEKIATRKKH